MAALDSSSYAPVFFTPHSATTARKVRENPKFASRASLAHAKYIQSERTQFQSLFLSSKCETLNLSLAFGPMIG